MIGDHDLSPTRPMESDLAVENGLDHETSGASHGELAQIFDVPVTVSAILGHVRIPVGDLLKIGPGAIFELDRRTGEAIDILVNDRLVARGEVVLVDDRLGVTMTEIIRPAA